MRTLWRILRYLGPYRWQVVVGYVCLFIAAAAQLTVPLLISRVIDNGILRNDSSAIVSGALLIVGAVAVQSIFTYVRTYLFMALAERVSTDLRRQLYEHMLRLSFNFFDTSQSGQLMSRATEDINSVRRFLMFALRMIVYTAAVFLIVTVLLLREHVTLALIALAPMPFLGAIAVYFGNNVRPMFSRIQQQFGEMSNVLQENLAGTRVVRVFAREGDQIEKFEDSLQELFTRQMNAVRYYSFFFPFMQLIAGVSVVVILWYGGRQVLNGSLSIGDFVAFNLYLTLLSMPVRQLGWIMNSIARAIASGERIFEIIDTRPAIQSASGAVDLVAPEGAVRFDNVSFTYPEANHPALQDISLSASPNEVIGLIGPTGSGKSTLTALMSRFYDVSSGCIMLDNVDIRNVTLNSLRHNIGFVMQDTFLFSTSIRDNIAFGNPGATHEQVEVAAKIARAHDFIMDLPDGYDTELGERGVSLSGGQRQRVAIARALCSDPRVLVLDDATSSVDTETEYEIQQALKDAMVGRTTFVIAQRISTIKNADEILVLDRGRIIERGTHLDLVRQGGMYARLYDLQLKDQEAFVQAAD